MSAEQPIQSLPRTLHLDVLSAPSAEKVHEMTWRSLAKVGVGIPSQEIRLALREAGASVDDRAQRVLFSEELVEQALATAPAHYRLAARSTEQDLVLDGEHGYLSVDGNAPEVLDWTSGERRPSTKEDLARISRLADGLPEIGMLWQPVTARDVPRQAQSLHELHAQVTNTTKHIQMMTAVTARMAEGVVEIARVVAGGADELRQRPVVSAFQCSLSPMSYEEGSLESARIYAEAGVPCGFVVMPISCATGPATAGGLLVQSNAEVLAGIVSLQLLVPGAATFYGSCATAMDLRSGAAACGGPEDLFLQMASAQMARRYRVPSSVGTFATGAKRADWQAGLENGLSGMASCLSGADLLCGAGLLFGARVFSPEEMVMDCEIFSLIRHLVTPASMEIGDDIAEVIEQVGPGGHYLGTQHTLANMRQQWMPRLFDRQSWEEWEANGRSGPREAAAERMQFVLKNHEPLPLEEAMEMEILRIIDTYERQT
jgi:trimethylamine--corrinoid protein Co-methyltransferase